MSTYNGEKYLVEQIESILNQKYSKYDLLIRDDGSTDETRKILKKYENNENIKILYGNNIGFAQSFLFLLEKTAYIYDYIMFSDQDDVWSEGKVEAFAKYISGVEMSVPCLYFCAYEMVTNNLKHIAFSKAPRVIDFESALVENIVTGCTCGMNASAARIIVEKLPEKRIKLHDWWAYLVVSAFGRVYYDEKVRIKYRQHAGNAIGAKYGFIRTLKRRINLRLHGNRTMEKLHIQASLFKERYAREMSEDQLNRIESFVAMKMSIADRIKWVFNLRPLRQDFWGDLFLRLAFLFWF